MHLDAVQPSHSHGGHLSDVVFAFIDIQELEVSTSAISCRLKLLDDGQSHTRCDPGNLDGADKLVLLIEQGVPIVTNNRDSLGLITNIIQAMSECN